MKTVLKFLPDGGYIQLPEDFSGLDLLGEVCSLDREKLDSLLEEQVIRNPGGRRRHTRIPDDDLVVESLPLPEDTSAMMRRDDGVMSRTERSSEKQSTTSTKAACTDSILFGGKRIRSWETSEKGISSDDNVNKAEKVLPVAKEEEVEEPKNNNTHHPQGSNPPPAMPATFRNKILELAGPGAVISEEKLLIQKTLTSSDVAKNQNRLSIPAKQLGETKFLTDEEDRLLATRDGKNVGSLDNVTIIEPSLETSQVSLRAWEMGKANGTSSTSYVITKTWNGIRDRNQLEEGMTVQVWAIRVNGKLWFALVRLPD